MDLPANSLLRKFFWCQDCGACNTDLTQEPETNRMICADRAACEFVRELDKT